jgi:hypothetical protein
MARPIGNSRLAHLPAARRRAFLLPLYDNRVRIALRLDRQLGTADMREMDEAGERYAAFIGKKAEVLHNR